MNIFEMMSVLIEDDLIVITVTFVLMMEYIVLVHVDSDMAYASIFEVVIKGDLLSDMSYECDLLNGVDLLIVDFSPLMNMKDLVDLSLHVSVCVCGESEIV